MHLNCLLFNNQIYSNLVRVLQMADIEKNDDNEPSWLREPKEDSALNSKNSDSAAELSTPIAPSNAESSRVPLPTTAKKMKWKQPSTTIRTVSVPEEDCCCCPTDPVMYYLRIYHFFAGLACFLAIIGDIYYLINNEATWHEIALHTFSVLFSVIMLAVELEIQFIVHRLLLLEQWVFRGLLYWHIGVITSKS